MKKTILSAIALTMLYAAPSHAFLNDLFKREPQVIAGTNNGLTPPSSFQLTDALRKQGWTNSELFRQELGIVVKNTAFTRVDGAANSNGVDITTTYKGVTDGCERVLVELEDKSAKRRGEVDGVFCVLRNSNIVHATKMAVKTFNTKPAPVVAAATAAPKPAPKDDFEVEFVESARPADAEMAQGVEVDW